MSSPIPGPGKQFVLGVVYAVLQLDGVFDRLNERRREYGDCEVLPLSDGGYEVVYRASFPLPTRTQQKIETVLKSHHGVREVTFGDLP